MSLREYGKAIWDMLVANAALVFLCLVSLVGIFVVWRPFEPTIQPTEDDIATAWNESIGRLGITPVYPPTEDLSVGDVWAYIAEIDEGATGRSFDSRPLLGKAVRIGHIDQRGLILASARQPTFAETTEPIAPSKMWRQNRWEADRPADVATDRIPLSITAFPGVTINHQSRSTAQAGAGSTWFGAQRQSDQQEQIIIKSAETYGIQSIAAISILNDWCAKQKELCQDDVVRKILSFTVGDLVLQTTGTPKKYRYRIGVQFVTRVFLMRQIEHRYSNAVARGAALQAGTAKAEAPPVAPTDDAPGGPINGVVQGLAPNAGDGSRLSRISADGFTMSLTETFQRPVAFGYRNVTISLKPSVPEITPCDQPCTR